MGVNRSRKPREAFGGGGEGFRLLGEAESFEHRRAVGVRIEDGGRDADDARRLDQMEAGGDIVGLAETADIREQEEGAARRECR